MTLARDLAPPSSWPPHRASGQRPCPSNASDAQILRAQGFQEAYALVDGFDAWQTAGGPIEPK
jgi:rhodanese-related sulfurtransferase